MKKLSATLLFAIIATVLLVGMEKCFGQHIRKYEVISVNDTFLTYYYLIKVNDLNCKDTIGIFNIISEKIKLTDISKMKKICVGSKYKLQLNPVYAIMEKYQGIDSVWYSLSSMRSVKINGELLISQDGKYQLYKTNQFKDCYYLKKRIP